MTKEKKNNPKDIKEFAENKKELMDKMDDFVDKMLEKIDLEMNEEEKHVIKEHINVELDFIIGMLSKRLDSEEKWEGLSEEKFNMMGDITLGVVHHRAKILSSIADFIREE